MKTIEIAFWISYAVVLSQVLLTLGAHIIATLWLGKHYGQYLYWKDVSDKILASLPLGSILLISFSGIYIEKLTQAIKKNGERKNGKG